MTDQEKIKRMKELGQAMYDAAQYLTTDASRLRKAMAEWHQFIIYEYVQDERRCKAKTEGTMGEGL